MPYARDNEVSTDPLEGGIYISFEDYVLAVEGMMEGKVVHIIDGVMVLEVPPPSKPQPEIVEE